MIKGVVKNRAQHSQIEKKMLSKMMGIPVATATSLNISNLSYPVLTQAPKTEMAYSGSSWSLIQDG